ncbi:MAG: hypothetical protein IPP90_13705 [Gemmatimonadaceae bacterium]|nr:hypothetical protein [Gemmatimonadaceae bacterium]
MHPKLHPTDCDWVIERLDWGSCDVGTCIPQGFEQYLRILHPAHRHAANGHAVPVLWCDIASANGCTMAEVMRRFSVGGLPSEFGSIESEEREHGGTAMWQRAPGIGSLPGGLCMRLVSVLTKHTQTPASSILGIWDGYGGVLYPPDEIGMMDLPFLRRLYLYQRPLSAVMRTFQFHGSRSYRAPNLWWPADRSWCVATEIDYAWTYVGGTDACIAEIAADRMFESLPARIDEGNYLER